MRLFGQIVRTLVNATELPATLTVDALASIGDVGSGDGLAPRTKKLLRKMKDEAAERE